MIGLQTRLQHQFKDIALLQRAVTHRSFSADHNERLEFLGDAVLSSIVAHYLFKKYPYKGEGFLTEMRSKMVNRQQLNHIAIQMGLKRLTKFNKLDGGLKTSQIFGNTLEALVGAIYLDKGFKTARDFVVNRLVGQYLDIEKLMTTAVSHKALVMKWAQQQKKVLRFQHDVTPDRKIELHVVTLYIDEEAWFTEENHSRKKAEELCCEKAVRKLNLTV